MWTWSNFKRRSSDDPPPRYAEDGPIVLKSPEKPRRSLFMTVAREPSLKERLAETKRECDTLARRLSSLERALTDPERGENTILYFRLRAVWDSCHQGLVAMADRFRARHNGPTVQSGELSLARRRAINTMLIAAAQEYYLAYCEEQIADMARLAMRKPVEQAMFGLVEDCLRWQALARELSARLNADENHQKRLRERAKYLHGRLRFDDDASLPRADSLNSMPRRIPAGKPPPTEFTDVVPVNVLAFDYWGLSEVLLK